MNIRLYHPNSIVENTTKSLSKEHGHYVVNVMRLKLGSCINFFNKDGSDYRLENICESDWSDSIKESPLVINSSFELNYYNSK